MKRMAIVGMMIVGVLVCVRGIHNRDSGMYIVESVIPCTEQCVRRIIVIPQVHVVALVKLMDSIKGSSTMSLISERQKQIYFALTDLQSRVVFSEGITVSPKSEEIDDTRISRINRGVSVLGLDDEMFVYVNMLSERVEIEMEALAYESLVQFVQIREMNGDKPKLVSYYKNNRKELVFLPDDALKILFAMDDDELLVDELNKFRDRLVAKEEKFNAKLRRIKKESEEHGQKLLRKYPYFAGGDLKLASEGKIKVLPGESSELNDQASALLDDFKKKRQELEIKLLKFEVSVDVYNKLLSQQNSTEDLMKVAEDAGVLSEYLAVIEAKKAFDEAQERRDDFLVESVAKYNGPEFDIPVVFGSNHYFIENVEKHNQSHPESQICLSRVKWIEE